jgi:hypothetical protein
VQCSDVLRKKTLAGDERGLISLADPTMQEHFTHRISVLVQVKMYT